MLFFTFFPCLGCDDVDFVRIVIMRMRSDDDDVDSQAVLDNKRSIRVAELGGFHCDCDCILTFAKKSDFFSKKKSEKKSWRGFAATAS